MRILVLAVAIVGLFSLPGALAAAAAPPPPSTMVAMRLDDSVVLSWSPVPGAAVYQVLAGDTRDTLKPIAMTSLTLFMHTTDEAYAYYGVASVASDGRQGRPNVLALDHGDCVSTSSEYQMSVSLHSCWNWIP